MDKPLESLRIISCHLGGGASVTAIKDGRSVDTSMGFTPLEGLMMGTRSGDIDAGAVIYLLAQEGMSVSELNAMLNRESGLRGISGVGCDMRDIEQGVLDGHARVARVRHVRIPCAQIHRRLCRGHERRGCHRVHRGHRRTIRPCCGRSCAAI